MEERALCQFVTQNKDTNYSFKSRYEPRQCEEYQYFSLQTLYRQFYRNADN
jgi:hypothetical protein